MNPNTTSRIFSGSLWGILAKILDALAKFITIPMLVGFYGKADYGLIALAFSLNAYLRLMDLGFNVGAVRYFSMWTAASEWGKIGNVSRSSIVFYGVVGLLNAIVFLFMSAYGAQLFNLTDAQEPLYRQIMYILAFSTVLSWLSSVVIQLLSAKDELGYVNRITVISSVLNFVVALLAIQLQWSLIVYFIGYTLTTLIPIPFYIARLRVFPISRGTLLAPRWHGSAFREILNYSLAIFVMGLFQLTANNLRPLLLGKFADGMEVLTDYRVIQTIAMLIVAFGGVFMQVLLPSASKAYAEGNQQRIERMIFEATKYISIFLAFVVFALILNADEILRLYMGAGYSNLSLWLSLWLLTVLLSMHNTPVASLVLSTGKTRFLVYSSAVACIVSLPITVIFADTLQVGAAVIGYLAYMVLQIGFFYSYYIPKVLKLDGFRLFTRAFLPAVAGGVLALFIGRYAGQALPITGGYGMVIANSVIFGLIYVLYLFVFVVRRVDIRYLKETLMRKGKGNA
ncbi:lipopolysaccharide biosynthesis protein [Parapedobacter indicus]|uniref:Membrane protein involved in the export of O-antigen and teichoic acid n=1 Tax=Parapedobacter indicus TaxID=1477437 RepID=A0A1I3EZL1_9SPHI|nr:oligosaccharide flippase family protein [Parapedobacter indicus]PPL03472.1 O-antigen/teichoic acid export membrane protein [Parapedobacter indicus]SFI03981.1 Membrane protein involved in the export of O-antigen and teichoic acid [Parapedobacter indicus]